MENEEEIWCDIPDYKGYYQISTLGRVKSLSRVISIRNIYSGIIKEKILKCGLDGGGYAQVILCKDGSKKMFKVHSLVAIAFLNHKPCGKKLVIDHKNEIKTDNRLKNLQIISQRENTSKSKLLNKKLPTGVYRSGSKYMAQIQINKKRKYLGTFSTKQEASLIYKNELKKLTYENDY
jgi:NUMOD4 motif-containing protein/HNH endonuclease